MQKRETILLSVLGVVIVVAIIILVVTSSGSSEPTTELPETASSESQVAKKVMVTLESAQKVLRSDKFLTLTTFGKVPVTVEPSELGKTNIFN